MLQDLVSYMKKVEKMKKKKMAEVALPPWASHARICELGPVTESRPVGADLGVPEIETQLDVDPPSPQEFLQHEGCFSWTLLQDPRIYSQDLSVLL